MSRLPFEMQAARPLPFGLMEPSLGLHNSERSSSTAWCKAFIELAAQEEVPQSRTCRMVGTAGCRLLHTASARQGVVPAVGTQADPQLLPHDLGTVREFLIIIKLGSLGCAPGDGPGKKESPGLAQR
jgi:hypothetical protein